MASNGDDSAAQPSMKMKMVISTLKSRWPRVVNISTETFHTWIREGKSVVILDTRPSEEYDVSHIEGAIRVDPDGKDVTKTLETIREQHSGDTEVSAVCYCSLGYRSSNYASILQQKSTESPSDDVPSIKAYNLEGCLFKWANEGRPMVNINNKPTTLAHPYSIIFGKLLKADLRCYKPQESNI